MAARTDIAGEWVRVESAGGLVSRSGYVGRSIQTPNADIHPHTCMESSKLKQTDPVSNGVGNVHELHKRESSNHVNELPSAEAILQHVVLLRGQVGKLRDELRKLESAFAMLAKAAEQRQANCASIAIESVDKLSGRQRKALILIARGLCMKEIARSMNVNVKTAEYFWGKIKRTLGVNNYVQATSIAFASGLI